MKGDIDYHERDRRFVFDGRMLDREPHVKIDDHTAPTEVGRIYFALDTDGRRLVVESSASRTTDRPRRPPPERLVSLGEIRFPRRPPWRRPYGR